MSDKKNLFHPSKNVLAVGVGRKILSKRDPPCALVVKQNVCPITVQSNFLVPLWRLELWGSNFIISKWYSCLEFINRSMSSRRHALPISREFRACAAGKLYPDKTRVPSSCKSNTCHRRLRTWLRWKTYPDPSTGASGTSQDQNDIPALKRNRGSSSWDGRVMCPAGGVRQESFPSSWNRGTKCNYITSMSVRVCVRAHFRRMRNKGWTRKLHCKYIRGIPDSYFPSMPTQKAVPLLAL